MGYRHADGTEILRVNHKEYRVRGEYTNPHGWDRRVFVTLKNGGKVFDLGIKGEQTSLTALGIRIPKYTSARPTGQEAIA